MTAGAVGPVGEPVATVLVVKDEESFVEALSIGLSGRASGSRWPGTAPRRSTATTEPSPDLVLLDVMLPTISGIEVCRQIRTRSRVPIIMVSARTSEIDTVVGLEVGDVRLDEERHEVFVRNQPAKLPLKEFELLTLLLDNAGRVLTRDTLIDRVWGPTYLGDGDGEGGPRREQLDQ